MNHIIGVMMAIVPVLLYTVVGQMYTSSTALLLVSIIFLPPALLIIERENLK